VLLTQAARSVTGDRLTYFSGEERYVMAGAPVRITEECRETTGKILTFFRSSDRILVDGNEQIRTQTKSGSECQGPRVE
jgi:lipopolysaccharide export system protein LptA